MTEQRKQWCEAFQNAILELFPGRVLFLGIQGSQRRGEATEQSDIDMVVILDELGAADLRAYRQMIEQMPEREKMCGFVSGKSELAHWPRADLFQFYYDTQPILGDLCDLFPRPGREEAREALKMGAANLYHAACHCYLFEEGKAQTLAMLYKGIFFLLQADAFCKEEIYYDSKQALGQALSGEEAWLFERCMRRDAISNAQGQELDELFTRLIAWCAKKMAEQ